VSEPGNADVVNVEIWSDVVCPWCYIGKRRVEAAVAALELAGDEQAAPRRKPRVEVRWRSFQLDPTAAGFDPAVPPVDLAEHLGSKYGGGRSSGLQMLANVTGIAAGEGLHYDLEHARGGNTMDAHRVLHTAFAEGGLALQGAVKERLLQAYFCERENISDPGALVRLAAEAGLAGRVARQTLDGDAYREAVEADQAQAHAFGASGVPFVVVDRRYGVSGAQPVEVFTDVLTRAVHDHEAGQAAQ
jgi:predicted DsbA family dithiol-disulfide isomerase